MTHYAPIPRPASHPVHLAITLRLADASSDLLVRHVRLLRDCVAASQRRWEFSIDAAVVLPNEVQLLCGFPDAEFGITGAIASIQRAFAHHVPVVAKELWSDDIDMLEIATPVVPLRRSFMENAPVRAGLTKRAEDWPYSSAHRTEALTGPLGGAVA